MDKKNTWLVLGGFVAFVIGWWFLGEWDTIEYMSERGQLIVSLFFLAGLIVISYFIMRKK